MNKKLSTYAKENDISYKTAWRMAKAGKINTKILPTGTILVKESIELKDIIKIKIKKIYLDPKKIGRLQAIDFLLKEWQEKDQKLMDREGFLEHLKKHNIGNYAVKDTVSWMKVYKTSRKKCMTVSNLLFDKARIS